MYFLSFAAALCTETEATQAVMNACRANPERLGPFTVAGGLSVTFTPTPVVGGHEACVRNADGIVVALANVDEFDV